MRYLKKYNESNSYYDAIEIYITIIPTKLEFDKSFEYNTEPFYVSDGYYFKTTSPMINSVYVNILKVEKKRGDTFTRYNNEIQNCDNFDNSEVKMGNKKTSDGGVHHPCEFYWEAIVDKTNKQLIATVGWYNDLPNEIKKIVDFLLEGSDIKIYK